MLSVVRAPYQTGGFPLPNHSTSSFSPEFWHERRKSQDHLIPENNSRSLATSILTVLVTSSLPHSLRFGIMAQVVFAWTTGIVNTFTSRFKVLHQCRYKRRRRQSHMQRNCFVSSWGVRDRQNHGLHPLCCSLLLPGAAWAAWRAVGELKHSCKFSMLSIMPEFLDLLLAWKTWPKSLAGWRPSNDKHENNTNQTENIRCIIQCEKPSPNLTRRFM